MLRRTELWRGFHNEDVEVLERCLKLLQRFPRERTKQAVERWKAYLKHLDQELKRRRYESRAREVVAVIKKSKRLERTFFDKEAIR